MRGVTRSITEERRPPFRSIHQKIMRYLANANHLLGVLSNLDAIDKNDDPKDLGIRVVLTASEISQGIGESPTATRKACNELARMDYIFASTADSTDGKRGRKPTCYYLRGDFYSAFVLDERDKQSYLETEAYQKRLLNIPADLINLLPKMAEEIRETKQKEAKEMEEQKKTRRRGGWPSRKK